MKINGSAPFLRKGAHCFSAMYPFVKLTGWRTPRRHPEPCKRGKYGRAYILSCFFRPPPLLKGGIIKSLPLNGKRLTTFCASLALLHPLLSLTHWIFRSLMLPYKSSSHSAKCVRCAPRGRYHNPRPERPSNLRTLGPKAHPS